MSDLSRVEQLLRNALGEDIYEVTPQSRVEVLLAQLNELIEGLNTSVDPEAIASIVTGWLAENIHDGAVVDSSLSVAGAAAESKKVGDKLSDLKENLKQLDNDVVSQEYALKELCDDGNSSLLNLLNMFQDPTFAKGKWGTQNGTITIQNKEGSLSKIAKLERVNTSSGGYLIAMLPVSIFENGKTYRIKISFAAAGNSQFLTIRQNTNGEYGSTVGFILTDVSMTCTLTSNTRSDFYYDWTVNSSDFGNYPFIQVQFKVTADARYFFEPFIGLKTENTDYEIQLALEYAEKQTIKSVNYFNGLVYNDELYNIGTGVKGTSQNYVCSAPQHLEAGDYIFITLKSYFGTTSKYCFLFDSTDATVAGTRQEATLLSEVTRNGITYGLYTFTLSQDKYVAFNIGRYEFDDANYFMIVEGNSLSDYPNSYFGYFEPYQALTEDYKLNIAMQRMVNPLYGKKVVWDGDSICYGYGAAGGYGKIISERNQMPFVNNGVSGGTITYGTTYAGGANRHWICTSIENADADTDYIIVEGGANDCGNQITIGDIVNGYPVKGSSDTLDKTTLIGAMEYMCRTLVTDFSAKKVGFIFVHNIQGIDSELSVYWAEAKEKMIQALKKWGVPYIDLETQIPPLNCIASLESTYTLNGDGWHPNEAGYKLLYCDKIEAWMKTL